MSVFRVNKNSEWEASVTMKYVMGEMRLTGRLTRFPYREISDKLFVWLIKYPGVQNACTQSCMEIKSDGCRYFLWMSYADLGWWVCMAGSACLSEPGFLVTCESCETLWELSLTSISWFIHTEKELRRNPSPFPSFWSYGTCRNSVPKPCFCILLSPLTRASLILLALAIRLHLWADETDTHLRHLRRVTQK